jgi:hypothetical protein
MKTHRNPRPRLSKRPAPDNHDALDETAAKHPPRTSAKFDGHVDALREALGLVDALTDSLKRSFDERHGGDADPDVVDRHTSYLIDLLAEAGVRAFDELNRAGDALGSEDADARS